MVKTKIFIIGIFILFAIGLTSSVEFGYDNPNLPNLKPPTIITTTIIRTNVSNISLNELIDVNAPSPSDLNVLSFDSGTSKWIN